MIGRSGQQRTKESKSRKKLDKLEYVLGSKAKLSPPIVGPGSYFDGCVAILSRVYDPDRDRVIARSRPDGVAGMICWSSEIDKLEALCKLCKGKESLCYFMAGIHPDNISRTNKSQQDVWHLRIDEFSRERNCVAIYSGLNLTRRDVGSHFAQESMLRCMYHQAKSISVPLVLFIESRAVEEIGGVEDQDNVNANVIRAAKILAEEGWNAVNGIAVVILDAVAVCRGIVDTMSFITLAGFHVSLSLNEFLMPDCARRDGGLGSVQACLAIIPRDRLLLSSNSPHFTPQNISDESIRISKNEPSNFRHIVEYFAPLLSMSASELAELNFANSKQLFRLEGLKNEATAAVVGAENTARDERLVVKTSVFDKIPNIAIDQPDLDSLDDLSEFYACVKCSSVLFSSAQLIHRHTFLVRDHACATGNDCSNRTFCEAVHFLSMAALKNEILVCDNGYVSCSICSTKIGKQHSASDTKATSCPCGYELRAAEDLLRLTSSKVHPVPENLPKCKASELFTRRPQAVASIKKTVISGTQKGDVVQIDSGEEEPQNARKREKKVKSSKNKKK